MATGGRPLWASISLEEIQELIRHSAAELKRAYDKKSQLTAEQLKYNLKLQAEIRLLEQAHDEHWKWYRARFNETKWAKPTL